MNINLPAWIILVLGASSPPPSVIASGSTSATTAAAAKADKYEVGMMMVSSSTSVHHRQSNLRHGPRRLRHLEDLPVIEKSSNFPLGNCQTDCDEDAQCGEGLICFQRNDLETVPGCSGEDNLAFNRKDVCVTKCTTEYCVLHSIGNNINPGTGYYGKCEGDCDNDTDCAGDLKCFKRDIGEDVPGCVGNTVKQAGTGTDYCYEVASNTPNPTNPSQSASPTTTPPTPGIQLDPVGNDGSITGSGSLGLCQGDCDDDSDCQNGLVCFFRNGFTDVPGCLGGGLDNWDYCIPDPNATPNPTPNPTSPLQPTTPAPIFPALQLAYVWDGGEYEDGYSAATDPYPLLTCRADCDSDDDCEGDFLCFDRDAFEEVPGCFGTGESGKDYCWDRASNPDLLFYVGNNDTWIPPLQRCEGDCDKDEHCEGDLICFKRDGFEPVFGCEGGGDEGTDYCTEPYTLTPTTSKQPSASPKTASPTTSMEPTKRPTTRNPSYDKVYEYTTEGTPNCVDRDMVVNYPNVQGPLPETFDTVLKFLAFGDTPYDKDAETCIAEDGVTVEDPCERFDCGSTDAGAYENTCTYMGPEYECVKDSIIPYMNTKMEADEAAFVYHCGDILSGSSSGHTRCNRSSFKGRQDLFSPAYNFLIVPGDNDWNECSGYDITKNAGDRRDDWREFFAEPTSPFNKFERNFPGENYFPDLERKTTPNAQGDVNPEMFFFRYNNIAIFGLQRVGGDSYANDVSPVDINAEWVADRLGNDCSFQSIIILSHKTPNDPVFDELDAYFDECNGIIPSLVIKGSSHPITYCMERDEDQKRVFLTVEAFQSGPLTVSVVRDYSEGGEDYFHVADSDAVISNTNCPVFA